MTGSLNVVGYGLAAIGPALAVGMRTSTSLRSLINSDS